MSIDHERALRLLATEALNRLEGATRKARAEAVESKCSETLQRITARAHLGALRLQGVFGAPMLPLEDGDAMVRPPIRGQA